MVREVGKLSKDGQMATGEPCPYFFLWGKGEDVGWLVVLHDLILTWLNLEDSK